MDIANAILFVGPGQAVQITGQALHGRPVEAARAAATPLEARVIEFASILPLGDGRTGPLWR